MEITSLRTKVILLTIGFICFAMVAAMAQGPGFPDPPVDTPFDGGVSLIAIAAVGYSVKKLNDRRKSK